MYAQSFVRLGLVFGRHYVHYRSVLGRHSKQPHLVYTTVMFVVKWGQNMASLSQAPPPKYKFPQ